MAPTRTRKRKSDVSSSSADHRSPIKKRKMGLTLAQKQALIDNLQLELTERARRLRAQYNVQAQQLRSRVEMRVNRIPTALRKLKMGDLLAKHSETQRPRQPRSPYVAKPPPVPAKDGVPLKPIPRKPVSAANVNPPRGHKRLSDAITQADDKENSVEPTSHPKKKLHTAAESVRLQAGQVLSPASTNARVAPRAQERPVSPAKSQIARPASPIKGKASSNLLSTMVEKAKATRGAAAARKGAASATAAASTSTRGRKPAAASASTSSTSTTATGRGRRKISQSSESSEASTGTVIKKTVSKTESKAASTKRTVMNTIKSATTKRAPAAPKVTSGTATTGRTLRKRGA